jgi:hypothetical protein
MKPGTSPSSLRLEADTETVEDLVDRVRSGGVRVPSFQRPLEWGADDVVSLFESVHRGYPVGSILLRKARAEAARISVGPVQVDAPETEAALWVVDGQQRLTALTGALARPSPIPTTPDDPWVVYFDARTQTFHKPPRDSKVSSTWVPVAQLLDASALSEWVFNWEHGGDPVLRAAAFQAGARIRQYRIPLYIVETDQEQDLRDIFYRINKFGKSLKWEHVHDALFGRRGAHPSTLSELADELQALGMGRPHKEQLLSCLAASRGMDVTRNLSEHYRKDPKVLAGAVQEALPAIRSVLSFLKRQAEIPHLRLLPRSIPLVILTRFFALYPDSKVRTLTLLTRWTWRTLLSLGFYDERTFLRHGIAAIEEGDEERSAQELLALVPRERRTVYALPQRFDARAAESRIALIGMASLNPLSLSDGTPIDIVGLIEQRDVAAFRRILPGEDGRGPENRVLLPGTGSARHELIDHVRRAGNESAALRSHAISPTAAEALLMGDASSFLLERKRKVEEAVERLGERLAAWSRTDRPSISYLLQQAEAEL